MSGRSCRIMKGRRMLASMPFICRRIIPRSPSPPSSISSPDYMPPARHGSVRALPPRKSGFKGRFMDENTRRAALDYHRYPQPGKLRIEPTKRMVNQRDLALADSPGVAPPGTALAENPEKARDYPARGKLVSGTP